MCRYSSAYIQVYCRTVLTDLDYGKFKKIKLQCTTMNYTIQCSSRPNGAMIAHTATPDIKWGVRWHLILSNCALTRFIAIVPPPSSIRRRHVESACLPRLPHVCVCVYVRECVQQHPLLPLFSTYLSICIISIRRARTIAADRRFRNSTTSFFYFFFLFSPLSLHPPSKYPVLISLFPLFSSFFFLLSLFHIIDVLLSFPV